MSLYVCLLADSTLSSDWVKEEIRIAHDKQNTMVPVFQESFTFYKAKNVLEPPIEEFLSYDGVTLLDKRSVYIDDAVKLLARIVKQTTEGQDIGVE
jgi:hypothetical protein